MKYIKLILVIFFISGISKSQSIGDFYKRIDSLKFITKKLSYKKNEIDQEIDNLLDSNTKQSIEYIAKKIDSLKYIKKEINKKINICSFKIDSLSYCRDKEILDNKPIKSMLVITKKETGLYKTPKQISDNKIKIIPKAERIEAYELSESGYFFKVEYKDKIGYIHISRCLYDNDKMYLLKQIALAKKRIKKRSINESHQETIDKKELQEENFNKTVSEKNVNPLSIKVIKTNGIGNNMVEVQIKITNTSGKDIHNSQVSCILMSASGKILDFKKHYVIKSLDGGLKTDASTYFEYILDANPDLVKSAEFKIESIKYK